MNLPSLKNKSPEHMLRARYSTKFSLRIKAQPHSMPLGTPAFSALCLLRPVIPGNKSSKIVLPLGKNGKGSDISGDRGGGGGEALTECPACATLKAAASNSPIGSLVFMVYFPCNY
jgi:hypothetical protein